MKILFAIVVVLVNNGRTIFVYVTHFESFSIDFGYGICNLRILIVSQRILPSHNLNN
jgi:hypothetical protein